LNGKSKELFLLFTWLGDLFIKVEFIDFTTVDFVLYGENDLSITVK